MIFSPVLIPETTPVDPILATLVFDDAQVPPGELFSIITVPPIFTDDGPLIAPTCGG